MRISDLKLTTKQISGTDEGSAYVIGISDGYEYADGKKTNNITHLKVEAVMFNNKYEKVIVKVAETNHPLTADVLKQYGGSVEVRFKNLTGKFYRTTSGEYALSCTAEGMEVIS